MQCLQHCLAMHGSHCFNKCCCRHCCIACREMEHCLPYRAAIYDAYHSSDCIFIGIMKSIALPGFSDILLHAIYSKSCLRKACGNHLWIRAAKVHLTVGWYHSSSLEPALTAASLLNTSSIIRRSLTPAQGSYLRDT